MSDDEKTESEKNRIRLVVENEVAQIAANHARMNDQRRQEQASRALHKLAGNLLRVIAGAGEDNRIPFDLHDAFTAWRDYAGAHQDSGPPPGIDELRIDHLFPDDDENPRTEEEWLAWAEPNPFRDYRDTRERTIRELRRSILREIASTITGSDLQVRRNERDIDQLLDRLEAAHDKYRIESRRPQRPNPLSQQMADQAIATLRAEKRKKEIADREAERDKQIANLKEHQLAGLRAAQSGDPKAFDLVDSFTMDVLGSMKFLKRKPNGRKSKRDWELTDLGELALSRHPGEIQPE